MKLIRRILRAFRTPSDIRVPGLYVSRSHPALGTPSFIVEQVSGDGSQVTIEITEHELRNMLVQIGALEEQAQHLRYRLDMGG